MTDDSQRAGGNETYLHEVAFELIIGNPLQQRLPPLTMKSVVSHFENNRLRKESKSSPTLLKL